MCFKMARLYFLKGLIMLQTFTGVLGVLDVTCYNNHPRIDIDGHVDLFIGGYRSGDDTDATVTFGRAISTGTGSGLPPGSYEEDHSTASAKLLKMPRPSTSSYRVQRIGAFNCISQKGDETETITTIIMRSDSIVTPKSISQTVSVGDDVTLSVTTAVTNTRWRHNGGSIINAWHGQKSVDLTNVDVQDGGIYECYQNHKYAQGTQAIFQLVVRACAAGKWGPPTCAKDCRECFNGGVCDERSGECVCAPGFTGDDCETVLGSNRWGQDGHLMCSSSAGIHSDACQGILFCLPHPYGCSCAAGYHGIDCNQACQPDTYGASCRSDCHCVEGVSCLPDTGECSDGRCHQDWYGVNCQKRCPSDQAPQTATGLLANMSLTEINVQWDDVVPCDIATLSYRISSKLQQCPEEEQNYTPEVTSNNEFVISNLQSYSTYSITLRIAQYGNSKDAISHTVSLDTETTAPQISPVLTPDPIPTADSLSFSWQAIPCNLQGGPRLRYAYSLKRNGSTIEDGITNDTTVVFSNLVPCIMYTLEVRGINDIGDGQHSERTVSTSTVEPGPVNGLQVSQTSSPEELSLSWQQSTANQCSEDRYIIRYNLINKDQCHEELGEIIQVETSDLAKFLDNLYPYSTYNVSITAMNSVGEGVTIAVSHITNTSEPTSAPFNISESDIGSTQLTLQWLEPPCGSRHGALSYLYHLMNESDAVIRSDTTLSTSVTIRNLEIFTNYTFQVAAVTEAGRGPWSMVYQSNTAQAPPSAPEMFQVTQIDKTFITVTWQQPLYPNGIIQKYSVESKVIAKPYDSTFDSTSQNANTHDVTNLEKLTYTFIDLKPTTKYELSVRAHSAVGPGELNTVETFTKAATAEDIVPPEKLSRIMESDITSTTVGIPLTTGEYVTGYQVRVKMNSNRRKRQTLNFGHHSESSESYIAAELPTDSVKENNAFSVGDNKTYGMYYNPPLTPGRTFTLYTAYVSRINDTTFEAVISEGTNVSLPLTDSTQQEQSPGLVVAIVVVLLTLLIIVLVSGGLVLKRRYGKDTPTDSVNTLALATQGNADGKTEEGAHNKAYAECQIPEQQIQNRPVKQPPNRQSPGAVIGPIKLTELEQYVRSKKEDHGKSLKKDFMTLPGDNLDSWDAAKKPENRKKNRYVNIVTYDKARVILETLIDDPHSDYINASYIDGLYASKKYIATQGPNNNSLQDFWRMIWQYNIKKIVMLTNLDEGGKVKCQQYWPDTSVVEMGGVAVNPTSVEEYTDYFIRTFRCQKSGEVRELRQYHYTTWPYNSVPSCPAPVLSFMKLVNDFKPDDAVPPVIHCSAGIGRTGIYIAIDAMIEQCKREGAVDVFGFVSSMRQNRYSMVQTTQQYQFIFDALLENMYCGDTSYHRTSFKSEFSKLKKIDRKTGKTGLMLQFEALDKVTTWPDEDKCQGGTNPLNVRKNRFPDIIPTDRTRPYLMTEVDERSTNYINAACIDSYRVRDQHIVTQIPLPETVADTWHMVYDYKLYTIVMVNTLDCKDPSMSKYWPNFGQTHTYGPYSIKCITEDERPNDVTVRTFQMLNGQEKGGGERTICQLSLRNWKPAKDEPAEVESIIALINHLKTWQEQAGNERVVVQCIDGVGASCAFSTIMLVLEKLKYEQNIDIFQTVRRLRMTRPQAVRNLVQYTFCYKTIEAYLASYSTYSNLASDRTQSDLASESIYANVTSDSIYANV